MNNPPLHGIAADVRSQLVIDRYSSVLSRLPLRRQVALADPKSLDARIWNAFRTLEQLDPALWLPRLLSLGKIRAIPQAQEMAMGIGLTLWKRVKPPPERLAWLRQRALRGELRPPVGRRRKGRVIPLSQLREELRDRARRRLPLEEPVEVDVIVKCSRSVVFVKIPRAQESPGDPSFSDSSRTCLARLIDAGLSYAEGRSRTQRCPVDFTLLLMPEGGQERAWARAVRPFASRTAALRRHFPHRGARFDPSSRLRGLGIGSWDGMRRLLLDLRRESSDPFEVALLDRVLRHGNPQGAPASA
jgi:hypothetical protein